MIEFIYVFCGLALPFFYAPQIIRLARDQTKLAGYSVGKSAIQFSLRIPALIFALFVVQHPLMNLVVGLDVAGRAIELGVALHSMHRQGVSLQSIASGWMDNIHPSSVGWKRLATAVAASASLAVFVSHAIEDDNQFASGEIPFKLVPTTGGYLDSR